MARAFKLKVIPKKDFWDHYTRTKLSYRDDAGQFGTKGYIYRIYENSKRSILICTPARYRTLRRKAMIDLHRVLREEGLDLDESSVLIAEESVDNVFP